MTEVFVGANTIIASEDIAETIELMEETETMPRGSRLKIAVNVQTILISVFIFVGILVWLEFIRTLFDTIFSDEEYNFTPIGRKFWYAVFITTLALILIYIVYRIFNPCVFQ